MTGIGSTLWSQSYHALVGEFGVVHQVAPVNRSRNTEGNYDFESILIWKAAGNNYELTVYVQVMNFFAQGRHLRTAQVRVALWLWVSLARITQTDTRVPLHRSALRQVFWQFITLKPHGRDFVRMLHPNKKPRQTQTKLTNNEDCPQFMSPCVCR